MKKAIKSIMAIILALVLTLSLAACGKDSATRLSVGETAATDIAEVTLNKAAMGFYVKNAAYDAGTREVSDFEDVYLPTDNAGSLDLSASKGNVLVCIDFTLKNTDRNIINLATDKIVSFTVTQNKNSYPVLGYDLDDGNELHAPDYARSIYSKDGGERYYSQSDSNFNVDNVLPYNIRVVGIANFEPDFSAPFELTVELKTSDDKTEKFVYEITP